MSLFKKTLLLLCISSPLLASEEIGIEGQISHLISPKNTQVIELTRYKLSPNAKLKLSQRIKENSQAIRTHALLSNSSALSAFQLGMNHVPVLDQGHHGSCVTFAVTAALDAAIGKSDYISQLCSLSLGQYLENHSYHSSGWNGSTANIVLNQMNSFGIINKENQRTYGCGGLTEYPLTNDEPLNEMNIDEFHQYSENLDDLVETYASQIIDPYQFIQKEISSSTVISQVKLSISRGNRVLVGMLLPLDEALGAWGSNHTDFDSWVLTDELKEMNIHQNLDLLDKFGGHELIITGYDDNLIIKDNAGEEHKGAFTLRNSWGTNAGDSGNYYVSYDYFAVFAWDVIRLRTFM